MNASYLMSVLDLYLKKTNEKLNIEIIKYNEYIKFNFFYDSSSINKTYISIDKDSFVRFSKILFSKIQKNEDIIEELIDEENNYIVKFKKRTITFSWFNQEELKYIRSHLEVKDKDFTFNNINIQQENNDNTKYEDKVITKNSKFAFSMGFSSFMTLFLSAIWFLDIFMIALWIFKALK